MYLLNHTGLLNDLFHLMVPGETRSDFSSDSEIWYSSRIFQQTVSLKELSDERERSYDAHRYKLSPDFKAQH